VLVRRLASHHATATCGTFGAGTDAFRLGRLVGTALSFFGLSATSGVVTAAAGLVFHSGARARFFAAPRFFGSTQFGFFLEPTTFLILAGQLLAFHA